MNVNIPFADQLYGTGETAQQATLDNFTSLGAQITAGWLTEHTSDNHHATITATGSISERGRTTPMGEWIDRAFNASDFTIAGAGNSWVVSPPAVNYPYTPLSYMLVGKSMLLNVDVLNSTLTATGTATNYVTIAIPGGYRVKTLFTGSFIGRRYTSLCYMLNGSVVRPAIIQAFPGTTTVQVTRTDTNLQNDLGATFTLNAQIWFEIA